MAKHNQGIQTMGKAWYNKEITSGLNAPYFIVMKLC